MNPCKLLRIVLVTASTVICLAASQSVKPTFSIKVSTARDVVKKGEELRVKIELKNISDHEISVARSNGEDQGELFNDIIIHDGRGNLAPTKKKGGSTARGENPEEPIVGSTIFVRLQPGASLKEGSVVDSSYDVSNPGKYTIQVERMDDETKAIVKSNTITVTVTTP